MAYTCTDPVCSTDCTQVLPAVDFSICAPEVHFGQISKLYITNIGNALTDAEDAAEWNTRIGLPLIDATRIIPLSVVGSKAAAAATAITIDSNTVVYGAKDHTVNFKVYQTNATNYNFLRALECNKKVLVWYQTFDGQAYGGNEGIEASITLNEVIPESNKEAVTYEGTLTWSSKYHPCRFTHPLA